jgi:hypothetical protein
VTPRKTAQASVTAIEVAPGLRTPERAVAIWLAVLAHAKVPTLSDLETIPGDLVLTDDQLDALRNNAHILALVGHRAPVVSIAICPECRRWSLCTEPAKSKCKLTMGCPGKPVRIQAAKRVKVAADAVEPLAAQESEPELDTEPEIKPDQEPSTATGEAA